MTTRDDEQARPGQGTGKETEPTGTSKSSRADADDETPRVNLKIDWRADDSRGAEDKGVAEDRPRDGT